VKGPRIAEMTKKAETLTDRVEQFAQRRRMDVGDFVRRVDLKDGYSRIEFDNEAFYIPTNVEDGKAIYMESAQYVRPALRRESGI
jgi:hypothetical protein